jgi:hypothetical protein
VFSGELKLARPDPRGENPQACFLSIGPRYQLPVEVSAAV